MEQDDKKQPEPEAHDRPAGLRTQTAQVPLMLQMEATECGAACLGMILEYYGRTVPLEELRVRCGVSRDGSKAGNIVRAAQGYGLECIPFKAELSALFEELPLPLIAFWSFNHFVIIEGCRKDRVLLCDPGFGHRSVSWEEFDHCFTGVVLTFKPGPEFQTGGRRENVWGGLIRRLQPVRWPLLFALLASLLLIAPGLAIPAFARIFVDRILVEGYQHWLWPLLLWMAAVLLVRSGLVWVQQYYLLRMNTKLASVDYCRFLWQMLRLPISFFSQRHAAEISQRAQLNDQLAGLLSSQLSTAALNILMVGLYLPVMALYDPWLALIAAATGAANLLLVRFFSARRKELNLRLMEQRAKMTATTMATLQVIETIKGRALEEETFRRWSGFQARAGQGNQELGDILHLMSAGPEALLALARALVLVVGALRIMGGELTIGELTAFLILLEFFLAPVMQLVAFGGSLQDAAACIRRLDDVMRTPQDASFQRPAQCEGAAADGPLLRLPLGRLEFREVTFGYSPLDPPLIERLSFILEPGRRLALAGPSGCGKSTVSRLAAGLFQPWSGEILLDGRPRAEWAPADLYTAVALVDQDIFMFEGTLRENITLWDRTVRDGDVVRACHDACLHNDIAQRPGGYHAHVEENGANFSGGQRQRLEIARALSGNPRLLILDEASSALDPLVEAAIGENLRKRGCSCLLVAHRLSTIRDSEEILFLDQGRVVERGTHEQLMALDGRYAALMCAEMPATASAAQVTRREHGR